MQCQSSAPVHSFHPDDKTAFTDEAAEAGVGGAGASSNFSEVMEPTKAEPALDSGASAGGLHGLPPGSLAGDAQGQTAGSLTSQDEGLEFTLRAV